MADAADALVLVERDGHVGVVLLNRPKQLNALSGELMAALSSATYARRSSRRCRASVSAAAASSRCSAT
jgi:enoyl-CoA hydratase/carnithine racemase